MPDCRKDVILENVDPASGKTKQIGKIGHIIAHSPKGPRKDASYPKEKLDTYANWILLLDEFAKREPTAFGRDVIMVQKNLDRLRAEMGGTGGE